MPGIRAGVLEDVEPQSRDPSVSTAAELELDPLRPALMHRDEVLAACLGPAHRRPDGPCEPSAIRSPRPRAPCRRTRRRRRVRRRAPGRARDPSIRPSTILSVCGVCVEIQIVRRPSSPNCASVERGSTGHAASRWLTIVPSSRLLAVVEQLRIAAPPGMRETDVRADLLEQQYLVARAPPRCRSPHGSGSYSTSTSSAASTDASRDGASTTATMSPANRALSEAMNGRNIRSSISTNGGVGLTARSTSAAVNTRAPGQLGGGGVSIWPIRAWAHGERTNVTCSAPSIDRSSTYCPRPSQEARVLLATHSLADHARHLCGH